VTGNLGDRPSVAHVQQKDLSKMDSKYYLCEAENVDEGVNKVTPYDKPEDALEAASNSTAKVHFISTVNPLALDEQEQES